MSRLSVCLLGPFQAAIDGEAVTGFRSDKVRALLAYLVIESDTPHRRERLAGLLWPDWLERSARAYLRVALTNLRHVIGDHLAETIFFYSLVDMFGLITYIQRQEISFQDINRKRHFAGMFKAGDMAFTQADKDFPIT